ncbi:eugenol synthase 1-like [Bidens hawaiensis]|uniref:eugenol synthase 1-like n=1 Tax=Bidens hawaiensis TaxID=980011 RepID=UPI00404A6E34
MATKSKILIIGGTGSIGKQIVEASAKAGHPTFVLIREATLSVPSKSFMLDSFQKSGVTFIIGDLHDPESLVKAIKQVDVVISTKFYPSEFGHDVDRARPVKPLKTYSGIKAQIRRVTEAEGIPLTCIIANCFNGYFLPTLAQSRDKVVILGSGNAKVVFNNELDIATYTIKTVDDPRTDNKCVYINPPSNIYSFNGLVSLWEKKIGKTLEKVYLPDDQILKNIEESPFPHNLMLSISHSTFVKGEQTNFEIEPSFWVEASELYPDVKYTTVDEYLGRFV